MTKQLRITRLPNYSLRVPIVAEIERVKDNYGGVMFYADSSKVTGIDVAGQGNTAFEALDDLARIIDKEYKFMTSQTKTTDLRGYARKLVEKVGHHILSERQAA
ncbi:MAG TPA: hypothetical protein VHA12_02065 [Candidatus Nanoarchaeia archaeon]|nr:hypothetical protein [Candidatus Nanoarchaeia archaeon]